MTANSGLPHDLEHLIVDVALNIRNGFWGRVAAGAEFKSLQVTTVRPRRRPRSYDPGLARDFDRRSEWIGRLVTQAFSEAHQQGWDLGLPLPRLESIAKVLRARDQIGPSRPGPTDRDLQRTSPRRNGLASLNEGESLTRHWPTAVARH